MTKKQAIQDFWEYYITQFGSKANAIKQVGKTTLRCAWVDYVDYLNKDHLITDKQAFNWGQIL